MMGMMQSSVKNYNAQSKKSSTFVENSLINCEEICTSSNLVQTLLKMTKPDEETSF